MNKNAKPKFLLVVLLLLLVTIILLPIVWTIRVAGHTQQILRLVVEAKDIKASGLKEENLARACTLSGKMRIEVDKLRSETGPVTPLFSGLWWVPGAGPYLRQVEPLLNFSGAFSHAGETLCGIWQPVSQEIKVGKWDELSIAQMGERLNSLLPEITKADAYLEEAKTAGAKIDFETIPAQYRFDLEELVVAVPMLQQGILTLQDLPPALAMAGQMQSILDRVQSNKSLSDDFPTLLKLVTQSAEAAGLIRDDITPLLPYLSEIDPASSTGKYLGQLEPIITYLYAVANSGATISQVLLPAWQEQAADQAPDQRIGRLIIDHQSDFTLAQQYIDQATAARKQIDTNTLAPAIRGILAQMDNVYNNAVPVIALLHAAPGLLGAEDMPPYLVLVENRDELRATGGYISSFGLLDLEDGRIADLNFVNSDSNYVSEVRPAPEPMQTIMLASYLVARDANWSPDFPTAARQSQEVYKLMSGNDTSGVIAFDQGLIIRLLQFFGPIYLPEQNITVDASNVEATIVKFKDDAVFSGKGDMRKEFLSVLAPAIIEHAKAERSPQRQIALIRLLIQSMRQGHLFFYYPDTTVQSVLNHFSLDGSIQPGQGDYLMVVDSNLGSDKVDQYIKRSLTYSVDLSNPQTPAATLHLAYQFPNQASIQCHQAGSDVIPSHYEGYYQINCYWDYWRVFLPKEARLKTAKFEIVPSEYFDDKIGWQKRIDTLPGERGTLMIGGLVVVPPQQSKEVTLQTLLPAAVLTKQQDHLVYRLRIQKQPGIEAVSVELRIITPPGYVLSNPPAEWSFSSSQKLATWKGNLRETQDFILEFTRK
jgi:hypothetical protein